MGGSDQKHRLTRTNRKEGIVSVTKKVKKTAKVVRATGRFCMNPFCLHVAGSAKCSYKCCKTSKRKG